MDWRNKRGATNRTEIFDMLLLFLFECRHLLREANYCSGTVLPGCVLQRDYRTLDSMPCELEYKSRNTGAAKCSRDVLAHGRPIRSTGVNLRTLSLAVVSGVNIAFSTVKVKAIVRRQRRRTEPWKLLRTQQMKVIFMLTSLHLLFVQMDSRRYVPQTWRSSKQKNSRAFRE